MFSEYSECCTSYCFASRVQFEVALRSNRSNYSGDYSIDGDRIKLNGVLAEPLTFTFGLEEDTLTFYNDDGEAIYEYQKVD